MNNENNKKREYYVYLLVDPRDDTVFYVGKGTRARVLQHVKEATKDTDKNSGDKIARIKEIEHDHKSVKHYILRHNLTENEAFIVEAVVISLLKNSFFAPTCHKLTNMMSGFGEEAYGLRTYEKYMADISGEILDRTMITDKVVSITLKEFLKGEKLYETVRGNWNLSLKRAQKADYVFAEYNNQIIGVFRVETWNKLDTPNDKLGKRRNFVRFDGVEVDDVAVVNRYLYKRLPAKADKARNPIRYFNL